MTFRVIAGRWTDESRLVQTIVSRKAAFSQWEEPHVKAHKHKSGVMPCFHRRYGVCVTGRFRVCRKRAEWSTLAKGWVHNVPRYPRREIMRAARPLCSGLARFAVSVLSGYVGGYDLPASRKSLDGMLWGTIVLLLRDGHCDLQLGLPSRHSCVRRERRKRRAGRVRMRW